MGSRCNILIVDDSAVIRNVLSHALSQHPAIAVVGTAADPYEAREKIKLLDPDVLLLDVEMPRMNGLDFLERLMRLRPMPVIMFSSVTAEGSRAAVHALALGAVDVQVKPTTGLNDETIQRLSRSILAAKASKLRLQHNREGVDPSAPSIPSIKWNGRTVLIGASTGGVAAIEYILKNLPVGGPPIIIAQHMPKSFLTSFSERLATETLHQVEIADDGAKIEKSHVYVAPGGTVHTGVRKDGSGLKICNFEGPRTNGHYPSVDELFKSATNFADKIVAVLLTGIGTDGASGIAKLHEAGAVTLGQDEQTSVVYGMPRAAMERGAITKQLALGSMPLEIVKLCSVA
ncbi:chemotaxis-specific protein-glutamate methyltransferase CheB [Pseudooceanicola sp. C21-150M6]|uniref:chemotaxis-specific protein-glutamate methyltransferase CheB n=1 Tax=Pseudooceanicola sp. C21-150M6 TaxID=3434355 RepID=UPI003D7FE046